MQEFGAWEQIKPLGHGGQGEVFLVRSPKRIEERSKYARTIQALSVGGLNEFSAQEFAQAIFDCGRQEIPDELGAMKIFRPRAPGLEGEEQARQRLRSEIAVLERGKPGILRLLDSNDSERWIVTEYCPAGTLERHLGRYAGNAALSLAEFRPLVETVVALHKDGAFHRDIKPANIFVGRDGRLLLGDFGIVFLQGLPERITLTGESVGPHDYIPPWAETEGRAEELGPQFDIYMLGKLLWCMVAGRLKLPREWHRKREYDLAVKFAGDPQMYVVNTILDKCLVDDPDKCLPNSEVLLTEVDLQLDVLRRGGQSLADGVLRPCRVCGRGFYRAAGETWGRPQEVLAIPSGTPAVRGAYANSWRHEGAHYFHPHVCDVCKHVEFFMGA